MIHLPVNPPADAATPNSSTPTAAAEGDPASAQTFTLLEPKGLVTSITQDMVVEITTTDTETIDIVSTDEGTVTEEVADIMIGLIADDVVARPKTATAILQPSETLLKPTILGPLDSKLPPRAPDLVAQQPSAPPTKQTGLTIAQSMVEGRFPAEMMSAKVPVPEKSKTVAGDLPIRASSERAQVVPMLSQVAARSDGQSALLGNAPSHLARPMLSSDGKRQFETKDEARAERPIDNAPPASRDTSKNTTSVPTPAVQQFMTREVEKDLSKVLSVIAEADGLSPSISGSERTMNTTQTPTKAPLIAGAEMARQVAGQIAVAVSGQPGRVTEIALNPEELGRVRMSMSATETTITLHLSADRPETTDLLRRHIDTLAQEFRDLGYDDISFSFQGGQGSDPDDDTSRTGSQNVTADVEDADMPGTQRNAVTDGLDLRL